MNPRRRALPVIAMVAVLTGCTSQGAGGGEEITVGQLSVTVPEGWTEESASGNWDQKFVGDGIELQVSGSFSKDPNASTAFSRLDLPATTQLTDYSQTKALEDAEVEGADSSVRADFTYTEEGTRMEGIWVIAGQWPYPSTAAVALSGESLDSTEVKAVLDSIEFTKREGSSG